MIKDRVTVRLKGGLGNQLFIYAYGYKIAKKNGKKLFLNCNDLVISNKHHPSFNISKFGLPGHFYSRFLIFEKLQLSHTKIFQKIKYTLFKLMALSFLKDYFYLPKQVGFSPIEANSKVLYVDGYFQSWKYTDLFLEDFRNFFQDYSLSTSAANAYNREMESDKPIIVHIRLGDYLLAKNSYFGILAPNYYKNAMDMLDREHLNRPIWIFSDDITMARNIYKDVFPSTAKWINLVGEMENLDSLVLMSRGKAIIMSNSTFSLWSALLSVSAQQIIAPRKWFKNSEDPVDLIPPGWAKAESIWT